MNSALVWMLDSGWTRLEENDTDSGTGQETGLLTLPAASIVADVKENPGCVFSKRKTAIVAMTKQLQYLNLSLFIYL